MINSPKIENILFFILCAISIFTYSHAMTDSHIAPKWYFTIAFLLLTIIILLARKMYNKTFHINIYSYALAVITNCFIQALYGIFQWFHALILNNTYNTICGSFDNSSGFAISINIAIPFALLYLKTAEKRIVKIIMYTIVTTIFLAIVMSGSRTGLISFIAIVSFWLCTFIPVRYSLKIPLTLSFILFVTVGSYFLKKDSANGRFFIWQCSWEMIKDAPFFGHGIGCFRASYMDYQADYFKRVPNSEYSMLADNVFCPFNEYLTIILNFGFLGLFILLVIITLLIYCHHKNPNLEKRMALLSLVGIGVSAIFSYPFTYPFVWIVLFFSIYTLIVNTVTIKTPAFYHKKILYVLGITLCLGSSLELYQHIWAEYEWKRIAYHTTRENLITYTKLMPVLGENPYFLYNYAVSLLEAGLLDESLKSARECSRYWSDYNIELVLGKIYKLQKKYELAEYHYRKASYMCPCRFIPIYRLFELYGETNKEEKKYSMAQLIINKPIKVQSAIIDEIKNEIELYLEKYRM